MLAWLALSGPGPKGPSKLTPAKVAEIRSRRKAKASFGGSSNSTDGSPED